MDELVREMRVWRDTQFDPYHRNPAAPINVKVELWGGDGIGGPKVLMRWRDPPLTEDGGEVEAYLITWERVILGSEALTLTLNVISPTIRCHFTLMSCHFTLTSCHFTLTSCHSPYHPMSFHLPSYVISP
jgi:hypothetical protein